MNSWNVMQRIVQLLCILNASFITAAVGSDKKLNNQLHRVFHHTSIGAGSGSALAHMELAQVVLYFSQEPIVNKIPRIAKDQPNTNIELFFPGAELKGLSADELEKKMVDANTKALMYQIKLERASTPINGVRCTISFDKQRVAFDYDTFLSISAQHAVRLHFFNKQLLKKISSDGALLRTASNKRRIVIDCGHGGKDAGAIGAGQVLEKEVTLSVGLEVAKLLRQQGFEVCMTRDADCDIPLDLRTSYANTVAQAQAFISIHANASANSHACGVETYYASPDLFKKNSEPVDKHPYQTIIDQHQQQLSGQSLLLAQALHNHVISSLVPQQTTHNRRVKAAAAQVLIGTQVPASLIEIGFLSNKHEATLLADKRYQQVLAQGICNGVVAYCTSAKL